MRVFTVVLLLCAGFFQVPIRGEEAEESSRWWGQLKYPGQNQTSVASVCVRNWNGPSGPSFVARRSFWLHVGDLSMYDSYFVHETGRDYVRSFSGAFLGKKKSGGYSLLYFDGWRSFVINGEFESSRADDFFQGLKRKWPVPLDDEKPWIGHNTCAFNAVKIGDEQMSYVNYSLTAWLSKERRLDYGLELTELGEIEFEFKEVLRSQLSVPWE